jgi:hypothetical protein
MSLNDIKTSLKDTPLSGQALYEWAMSNNLSAQQIADATGRPLSSVYSDFRAGSKSKTAADKKKADDDAAAGASGSENDKRESGEAAGGLIHRRFAQGGISGEGNLNLNIPLDFGSGGGGGGGGGISLLGGAHSGPGGGFSGYNNTGSSGFGGTTTYTQTIGSTGPGSFGGIPEGVHSGMSGPKGVTATGPMLGGDYTSLNSDMMRHGGMFANGGMTGYALGGLGTLGGYSDGGRLLKGPGDGVSDSIPATIGRKQQPARLADGEFVVPARIVSELGNGSTDAGAKKLYAMMDRVQRARGKTTGKNKVAANSRADKYLPA